MTARTDKVSLKGICEACGKDDVSVVVMPSTYAKDGLTVSYPDEYSICEACGEEFYTKAQSMANSRAIAAAIRQARGLPTGEEIRDARISKLGMTLPQFEQALCVGPNTVGRWERGTVAPSGVATGMLWLAIKRPDVFLDFARERGVVPKRAVLSADLAAETSQGPSASRAKAGLTLIRAEKVTTRTSNTDTENTLVMLEKESVEA